MGSKKIELIAEDSLGSVPETLQNCLQTLSCWAADSFDLEELLSESVRLLYNSLPNGQENYGGKNPRIGKVFMDRHNTRNGKMILDWSVSDQYYEKWRYVQKSIAVVDLRQKTYWPEWGDSKNRDEEFWQTPNTLMEDTEKVMEKLGLKKEEIKKH